MATFYGTKRPKFYFRDSEKFYDAADGYHKLTNPSGVEAGTLYVANGSVSHHPWDNGVDNTNWVGGATISSARDLALSGRDVWVGRSIASFIARVNVATGTVLQSFTGSDVGITGGSTGCFGLTFVGSDMYFLEAAAAGHDRDLYKLASPYTGTATKLATYSNPLPRYLASDGIKLWTTAADKLYEVNLSDYTLDVVRTFTLQQGRPFNPFHDGQYLYCFTTQGNAIRRVSSTSLTTVGTHPAGSFDGGAIVVSD